MNQELEREFEEFKEKDKRLAGEYAYVLSVKHHRSGNVEESRRYARECLKIFENLDIQTLEDACSRLNVVDGIYLPGIIHKDVVKARFQEMGIL